jgi:hypothetical protein
MPKQETPESLLTKHLGAEAAKSVLGNIDKMVAAGASADKIEKAAIDEISEHIEKQVVQVVTVKIGPLEPIKVKPLQVSIKPAVKPAPAINVKSTVSVSISPPMYAKGTK